MSENTHMHTYTHLLTVVVEINEKKKYAREEEEEKSEEIIFRIKLNN